MNVLMKRLVPVVALALIPWLIPTVAHADGTYLSAVGGGVSPCEPFYTPLPGTFCSSGGTNRGQHFAFSATEDLTTMTYSGHAVFWFVDQNGYKVLQIQGPVTCLLTPGAGEANITFQVSQVHTYKPPDNGTPSAVPTVGDMLNFSATDGGSNGNQGGDMISTPTEVTTMMPPCSGSQPEYQIPAGNIVIAPQSPLIATPITDNSTYNILNTGDVYFNSGDGWLAA